MPDTVSRSSLRPVAAGFLGCCAYEAAAALQDEIRRAVLAGQGQETLLLLEHPHVVTVGRNAPEGDLRAAPARLADMGVELHACDRGGRVTYHGPGQLVGYPVLDLRPDRRDVRRYVRDLQEVLVRTVGDFGLRAVGGGSEAGIGVWVGECKVASIGVHLRRWVTTHGFALNVTTDLSYFGLISPCGLSSGTMASIESLTGARPSLEEVAETCLEHFQAVFERPILPFSGGC